MSGFRVSVLQPTGTTGPRKSQRPKSVKRKPKIELVAGNHYALVAQAEPQILNPWVRKSRPSIQTPTTGITAVSSEWLPKAAKKEQRNPIHSYTADMLNTTFGDPTKARLGILVYSLGTYLHDVSNTETLSHVKNSRKSYTQIPRQT